MCVTLNILLACNVYELSSHVKRNVEFYLPKSHSTSCDRPFASKAIHRKTKTRQTYYTKTVFVMKFTDVRGCCMKQGMTHRTCLDR